MTLVIPNVVPPPVYLLSTGPLCLGTELAALGTGTSASAVWPTANVALFVPLRLPQTVVVQQVFWLNGTGVLGTTDCGVYDVKGNLMLSSGGTTQLLTGTIQYVDIADTILAGPALYYLGLSSSNAITAAFIRQNPNVEFLKACGMLQAANANPLPATVTFAGLESAYLPLFGVSLRSQN